MTKREKKSVFGIFDTKIEAERAVDDLKLQGFRNSDISVLMPTKESTQDFAHEKSTKAPEGASAGAAGGAVLGGTLGWLAGIGTLAIPGIGPFIAAGPIVATLAGAGAGGMIGGLAGALIGMGVPEYEAKRYEGMVKEGGILLSAHVDDSDWRDKAKDVLTRCGARDVATGTEESVDYDSHDDISDQGGRRDEFASQSPKTYPANPQVSNPPFGGTRRP
jgi:hypothetical protein